MARFSSLSLFTRLYLIIAFAMVVSGTASYVFIEKIHLQGVIDEYVVFTDEIYAGLVKEQKIILGTDINNLNEEINDVEGYLIGWQIRFNDGPPCDDCKMFGRSGNIAVFINSKNQFHSVYKLPKVEAWLIIFENNIFNFAEEPGEEGGLFSNFAFHDFEEIAILLFVFMTVAISIYWPVRVIQKQIETLIKTQYQFGTGNLQTRAIDKYTKPLDELASSFNSMASAISNTVNENQIFAQAVPHEVRTPLSRIQLAVGLLSQNNTNEHQINLLDNIDTYIDDISVLINQVVSFSKLNSAQDKDEISLYKTIKLSPFIEARIKATKCDEKCKVVRQMSDSLSIVTNPAYLRLLVDNLLKNASIHGKNQIVVTLVDVDGHIELSVEDDGDGIPEEFFDTIFIPFSRVDESRNRKTGGLGLGLAISKAACMRMNGKLIVENSPLSGAKFTCQFT